MDFDREFSIPEKTINDIIKEIAETNGELLSRLNDYDENGIPYWEKWHKMECECGKLKCPNCSEVGK